MGKACSLRFSLSLPLCEEERIRQSQFDSFHSIPLSIRSSFVDGARDNRLSRHGFRQGFPSALSPSFMPPFIMPREGASESTLLLLYFLGDISDRPTNQLKLFCSGPTKNYA